MGNKMFRLVILVVPLFLIIMGVIISNDLKNNSPEAVLGRQSAQMEQKVEEFNARGLDVMFFGMNPNGPSNLHARAIYSLADEALYSGTATGGRMIVMNDMKGNLIVTGDDFAKISDLVDNEGFFFVYLGDSKYGLMQQAGLIDNEPAEGTMSLLMHGNMSAPGFADENLTMPYLLQQELPEDELPVYNMILEMLSKQIYWN